MDYPLLATLACQRGEFDGFRRIREQHIRVRFGFCYFLHNLHIISSILYMYVCMCNTYFYSNLDDTKKVGTLMDNKFNFFEK